MLSQVVIGNSLTIFTFDLLKHYGTDEGTGNHGTNSLFMSNYRINMWIKYSILFLGADEMLPYIIYTLLLLSPKHMYSNLR